MAGQPHIPGWIEFDVTDLQVAELGMAPANIVKSSEEFEVSASFAGSGVIWTWLELLSDLPGVDVVCNMVFSAEGIGPNADELDLGTAHTSLTAGGNPYTAMITVPANTLKKGVYTLAGYATFEATSGGSSIPLPGVTGHHYGIGANKEEFSVYEH